MTLLLAGLTFTIIVGMVLSGYYLLATESEATQRLRAMVPNLVTAQAPRRSGPRLPFISAILTTVGKYGLGSDDGSLRQALSVAGLLVTTEAMIAEAPKKDSPAPAMPGGGMGGMGGMDF